MNVASAYLESSYLKVHHFAYHWYEGKVSVVRVYAYDLKHNRHFVLVATIADILLLALFENLIRSIRK